MHLAEPVSRTPSFNHHTHAVSVIPTNSKSDYLLIAEYTSSFLASCLCPSRCLWLPIRKMTKEFFRRSRGSYSWPLRICQSMQSWLMLGIWKINWREVRSHFPHPLLLPYIAYCLSFFPWSYFSFPQLHWLLTPTGLKKQKSIPSSISVSVPASALKDETAQKGGSVTPGKKKKNSFGGGGSEKKRKLWTFLWIRKHLIKSICLYIYPNYCNIANDYLVVKKFPLFERLYAFFLLSTPLSSYAALRKYARHLHWRRSYTISIRLHPLSMGSERRWCLSALISRIVRYCESSMLREVLLPSTVSWNPKVY